MLDVSCEDRRFFRRLYEAISVRLPGVALVVRDRKDDMVNNNKEEEDNDSAG